MRERERERERESGWMVCVGVGHNIRANKSKEKWIRRERVCVCE